VGISHGDRAYQMTRVKYFLSRYTWHVSDVLALVFFLTCAFLAHYWFTFRVSNYINVSSIVVNESSPELYVLVDRTLSGNFYGSYSVTIRDLDTNSIICSTGNVELPYRQYNESGGLTELPAPMPLSYWAHGGTCNHVLEDPLPIGHYVMRTCHSVQPLGLLPWKTQCWPLTSFYVPVREHKYDEGNQRG